MELPTPGGAIYAGIFSTIIVSFVAVAFYNLANYRVVPVYALIASIIWLLLIAIDLCLGITAHKGIRSVVLHWLAAFSRRHYVGVSQQAGTDPIVRFCFTLCKCPFVLLEIPASKINSIKWSAGQASCTTGLEMDGWSVFVWYQREETRQGTAAGQYREQALHMVGPLGPRSQAEATGRALVAFLATVGVVFVPSSSGCESTTSAPQEESLRDQCC